MGKMSSRQKRRRLIELRGQGVSYAKIAKEIGSAKTTVIRWSLELDVHINNAQTIEFEGLMEEYLATREHRIKALGTQLNNVTQALVECDYSKETPHRLTEIQSRITKEMQELSPKIEFHRKIPFGGSEAIKKLMDHTDTWPV
jgi:transposase